MATAGNLRRPASNGKHYRTARLRLTKRQPNVVLIDIGLPDMTGWELAKRLPRDALLIAVTARGEQDDFERSQRAGIRYHLVKPAINASCAIFSHGFPSKKMPRSDRICRSHPPGDRASTAFPALQIA